MNDEDVPLATEEVDEGYIPFPPRESRIVKVRLIYTGRAKPMPFDEDDLN